MWRFYGYYGGFSVVGNLRTYGQYADDSTFEIVPTWQNKLQAMAYEDALWTRVFLTIRMRFMITTYEFSQPRHHIPDKLLGPVHY
jgi:hypothetical protein